MVAFTRKFASQVSNFNDLNELQVPIEHLTDRYFYAPLFGVPSDGVTDATTAIHALRDIAGADAEIHFPDGDYLISTLNCTVEGQTWTFAKGAVFSLATGTNNHIITISADDVTLRGGDFDGNAASQSAGQGISITGDNVTLDGVTIRDTKSYGIYSYNNDKTKIRNCRVFDSLNTGIFVQNDATGSVDRADVEVSGCTVDRTGIAAASIAAGGIQVHGAANFGGLYDQIGTHIVNNIVRMPTDPTSAGAICIESYGLARHSKIIGNSCYGGSIGVSVSACSSVSVLGNSAFGARSYGFEGAGVSHCSYLGNTVDGNALTNNGFSFGSSAGEFNTISGNAISGCDNTAINLLNSDNSTVSNNTIEMASAHYAINIGSSDKFAVTGNVLHGASVGLKGVIIDASTKGTVSGNTITDFTQHGVLLFAASAFTLDDITISANAIDNCNVPVGTSLSGGGAVGLNVRAQANGGPTQNSKSMEIIDLVNNVKNIVGTGTPEGVVGASPGSFFQRTDGGAGTAHYAKESGTSGTSGWRRVVTAIATASETKDWGSIADGDNETEDVTVTGAALGDIAHASMSVSLAGLQLTAYVSAADTVTCVLSNTTGSAVDLGSGTLRVTVQEIV